MSNWELPTLAPVQYLDRKVQPTSASVLKFYSTELGLKNNLTRVSPETNSSNRFVREFPVQGAPAPFTDPPLVRSEPWSSFDTGKSSTNPRWRQFKSKFVSCIKSVKCRFTALGLLLGLILSLAALIPIVVIWQISASKTTTTSSPSSTVASSSISVYTGKAQCDSYFCEEQVLFITNLTITSLSLVVTIQRTGNSTYHNDYNTYSGTINSTHTTSSTQIIYTFFFQSGQVPAGNYTCAVQFNLPNLNHTTSGDTYSIRTTNICGITNSASGNFK